jgi:hypothetical protein
MKLTTKPVQKLGALVAVLLSVASLHAVTITLDSNTVANGGTNVGGNSAGSDNTRTFSIAGGLSFTVQGFSQVGQGASFTRAFVGQYAGGGLGVTNDGETGSDPTHKVDNIGSFDYLLFTFNQVVDINSFDLRSVGADSDFRLWIGTNVVIPGTPTNSLLSGFSYFENNFAANGNDRVATVNAGNLFGNQIVIGASLIAPNYDNNADEFKVYGIDVTLRPPNNTPGVPDGGSTIALLGVSLMGLAAMRKRSRA